MKLYEVLVNGRKVRFTKQPAAMKCANDHKIDGQRSGVFTVKFKPGKAGAPAKGCQ